MPFCPSCRYEYEAGVLTCPDCDLALVEVLPEDEDEPAEYHDWIPLARLMSTPVAEMVLEGLRVKGIPAVLHSEAGYFGATGSMGPSSYQPVGGAYTLLVPREFVADADAEGETILGDEWPKVRIIEIDRN